MCDLVIIRVVVLEACVSVDVDVDVDVGVNVGVFMWSICRTMSSRMVGSAPAW